MFIQIIFFPSTNYGETRPFITTATAATVAEIECGSTFRETCLATEIQKSFTKPSTLHGKMFPETCFAAPFQIKVSTCNSSFDHFVASLLSEQQSVRNDLARQLLANIAPTWGDLDRACAINLVPRSLVASEDATRDLGTSVHQTMQNF